jgi:hypothetical protein
MTDQQLRTLLKVIRTVASVPYPFPQGSRNDADLVFALARITGIAAKALATHDAQPVPPTVIGPRSLRRN